MGICSAVVTVYGNVPAPVGEGGAGQEHQEADALLARQEAGARAGGEGGFTTTILG